MYKWNSKCNSFEPYETEYETYTDENGEEQRREIAPTITVYTQAEVDAIFSSRGANQVIKDIDGVPTAVDFYTPEELTAQANAQRITELKELLSNTDYQAIKFAEGEISAEDYAPIKAQRIAWRAEINSLQEV